MSEENIIVTGVHFYLDSELNDWLVNTVDEDGGEKCVFAAGDHFSYDLMDQPFHCIVDSDGTDVCLKLYIRSELGVHTEGSADVEILMHMNTDSIDLVKNSGRIGNIQATAITLLYTAHQLRKHVLAQNKMSAFADMDLEQEGVIVTRKGDKLEWKRVAGKKRPAMACTTLFGGVQMMRPYFDEIVEAWGTDSLDLDELLEEAENGDESAMDRLAMAYLNGDEELGLQPNGEQAFYWFEKLAKAGSSNGQFNLGLLYAKGHGVERNFALAAHWMHQAAENGDTDAPALIEEYKRAACALPLAERGDAQAQADLAATIMKLGNSLEQAGSEQDYAESFKWAKKAADQNNGDGLWTLALAYEHGRGVKKNVKKAVELYQKGTDVGHAPSQHSLGCYYMRGEVVDKDEKKAFKLIKQSAEQGYELAYRSMGTCYQFGNGVRDDMTQAIHWYEKFLETNSDPELERKVGVFKMLEACAPTDEELQQYVPKRNLPDGYMEALEAFAEAENAEDTEHSPAADWMNGKLFVLSGLSNADMTRAEKIITDNGGILKSSVVLNTDYVIYDDHFGETKKIQRAKELIEKGKPIKMLTVQEFKAKLSGAQAAAPRKDSPKKRKLADGKQGCTICLLEGDQLKCWVQKLTVIQSGIPMEDAKLIFEAYNLSAGEYKRANDGDEDVSYAGLFGLDMEILEARKKLDFSEFPALAVVKDMTLEQMIKNIDRYKPLKQYFNGQYDGLRDFDWLPVAPEKHYYWIEMAPVSEIQYERYADELHHVYHVAELFGTELPFNLEDPETVTIFGSGKFEALADLSYGC